MPGSLSWRHPIATGHITTGDNGGAAPVACTLTSAGLAAQAGRWVRLAARAMTGRTETACGLRISFRAEAGAEEELRTLVAVENECCAWADWAVAANGGQLVLDVRSAGAGIATLHGMFTGLQPAGPPAATNARPPTPCLRPVHQLAFRRNSSDIDHL